MQQDPDRKRKSNLTWAKQLRIMRRNILCSFGYGLYTVYITLAVTFFPNSTFEGEAAYMINDYGTGTEAEAAFLLAAECFDRFPLLAATFASLEKIIESASAAPRTSR